jgi:hypothetical protein
MRHATPTGVVWDAGYAMLVLGDLDEGGESAMRGNVTACRGLHIQPTAVPALVGPVRVPPRWDRWQRLGSLPSWRRRGVTDLFRTVIVSFKKIWENSIITNKNELLLEFYGLWKVLKKLKLIGFAMFWDTDAFFNFRWVSVPTHLFSSSDPLFRVSIKTNERTVCAQIAIAREGVLFWWFKVQTGDGEVQNGS